VLSLYCSKNREGIANARISIGYSKNKDTKITMAIDSPDDNVKGKSFTSLFSRRNAVDIRKKDRINPLRKGWIINVRVRLVLIFHL